MPLSRLRTHVYVHIKGRCNLKQLSQWRGSKYFFYSGRMIIRIVIYSFVHIRRCVCVCVCVFLFLYIKRVLAKGKKNKYKKKSRLSSDPVKKIIGEIKNGGQFNLV